MASPFSRIFFSLAVLAGVQLVVGVEPGLDRTGVEAVFVEMTTAYISSSASTASSASVS